MSIAWACDPPNLEAAIGADPPAILVDAIGVYRMSLLATHGDETKLRREKAEQERKARSNQRR